MYINKGVDVMSNNLKRKLFGLAGVSALTVLGASESLSQEKEFITQLSNNCASFEQATKDAYASNPTDTIHKLTSQSDISTITVSSDASSLTYHFSVPATIAEVDVPERSLFTRNEPANCVVSLTAI